MIQNGGFLPVVLPAVIAAARLVMVMFFNRFFDKSILFRMKFSRKMILVRIYNL